MPIDAAAPLPQPFRPAAPPVEDRVAWPESFGTRFTVFVDTEEEFDWEQPLARENRATTAMRAMPATHRRFAERGVAVTYLVDHPIVTCPESVAILKELLADGRSAIGTQLHPWVNPPFEEEVTGPNSFTGNLPRALQEAKLDVLTEAITQAFGERPLVYRAGRYGLGPDTLAMLEARGYRIDSSMRSAYSYADQCGPDYRAIGNHGFYAGPAKRLVELPYTTAFIGPLRRGGVRLHDAAARVPRGRGVLSRLGLLNRVGLSPEDMPVEAALEAVRVAAGEGVRILNFAFHSPSVAPGHTPYVRTEADLAAFQRWWDEVLDLLDRLGVRPASLAQLIAAIDEADACRTPPASAIAGAAGGL